MSIQPTWSAEPEGLSTYFTNMEHLREAFNRLVAAPALSRRVMALHGVGGVGKSSLLRMFRLHCKSIRLPVALASGEEARSATDVLARWGGDLEADGVALPEFTRILEHYHSVEAQVDERTRAEQADHDDTTARAAAESDASKRRYLARLRQILADRFEQEELRSLCFDLGVDYADLPGEGKAAKARELVAYLDRRRRVAELVDRGERLRPDISWTADATADVLPITGPAKSALGRMGAEALADWLRGFLDPDDVQLLLDPTQKLTEGFLTDMAAVAARQRTVLMLDAYEHSSRLWDWMGQAARRMHPNVLLVIAGRTMPDWSRLWPDWLMAAQVEELKPMTDQVMRQLVQRYYATMRGGEPSQAQTDAIIRFARGLPMVVTSAVKLWIQYGVEDLQAVKPQVVADLADRLVEGVPTGLRPALEAAAAVRWFNKEILHAMTGQEDVATVYDELRRFPFVRPRAEGLALHDAMREMLDENLCAQEPERHGQLHARAAAYFEARLAKATGEQVFRLGLERLYHHIRMNEETGIRLFQELAEELVRYRLVDRLRALLNDAGNYTLEKPNCRLWREYYNARLAHLETRVAEAGRIYQAIAEDDQADTKLQSYALCDWGQVLEIHRQHGDSIPVLKRGLSIIPTDLKLASSLLDLGNALRRTSNLRESRIVLERAKEFCVQAGDQYGLVYTLSELKHFCLNQGFFGEAASCKQRGLEILRSFSTEPLFLKMELLGGFAVAWAWLGRLSETELDLRQAHDIARRLGLADQAGFLKDCGYVLGLQGKYDEAERYFDQTLEILENSAGDTREAWLGVVKGVRGAILVKRGLWDEAERELGQSLAYMRHTGDFHGMPEVYNWLGLLFETRPPTPGGAAPKQWTTAEAYYRQSLELQWTGRRYFKCSACVGLARVKYIQGGNAATQSAPLLAEAEQLAQQYEYNDCLAMLRLVQGHLAWDGLATDWGTGFDAALRLYRQALVYALRYNRFLLDQVMTGSYVGTPRLPIAPHCRERHEEGQRMLRALHDAWRTGVNDVGLVRADTISPIPEGLALLEAERIAREREPGDGSPQKTLVEQIVAALE